MRHNNCPGVATRRQPVLDRVVLVVVGREGHRGVSFDRDLRVAGAMFANAGATADGKHSEAAGAWSITRAGRRITFWGQGEWIHEGSDP